MTTEVPILTKQNSASGANTNTGISTNISEEQEQIDRLLNNCCFKYFCFPCWIGLSMRRNIPAI